MHFLINYLIRKGKKFVVAEHNPERVKDLSSVGVFSVYGDASSGSTSATYTGNADFVAALDIWREVSVDRWQVAPGSRSPGIDSFIATVESSGQFVLAAPR